MNRDEKFRTYDRIMAALVVITIVAMLLTSCTAQRGTGHQDHLRSTHTNNWVTRDNGGCGWAN
jgi:predicted small secreted protein